MLRNQVVDPLFPECPVRNFLARLGDKWSILVLMALDGKDQPQRFRDLERAIPDISQKMLALTLRELEADGLVTRQAYAEIPPRVEYALTQRAKSLLPHLHSLIDWTLNHLSDIVRDRQAYASRRSR